MGTSYQFSGIFCKTLRSVTVPSLSFSSPNNVAPCCPGVTLFRSLHCWKLPLSSVVPAFPNLRALIVDTRTLGPGAHPTQADLLSCRLANLDYQRQQRGWKSLTFVKANIGILCSLALQCEVTSLFIPMSAALCYDTFPAPSESVLSPLRPRHLRLSFESCLEDPNWGELRILAGFNGLENLRRLDINTYIKNNSDYKTTLASLSFSEMLRNAS